MEKKVLLILLLFFSLYFSSSWKSSPYVETYPIGINCEKNSTHARWINVSLDHSGNLLILNSFPVYNSSGNVGNCSLFNGFCCPTDYLCNSSSGNCYKQLKNYCEFLSSQTECEGPSRFFNGNLTFFELKAPGWESCGLETSYNTGLCINKTFCECYWTGQSCSFRLRKNSTCFNPTTSNPSSSDNSSCEYFVLSKEDKCNDIGKIIVSYKGNKNPPSSSIICQDFPKEYPCSSIVTLPFFTFFNLFGSLFIIFLIYYFFVKKNFRN